MSANTAGEAFRDEAMEQAARPLYRADLPYHNFDHALETIRNGREIIERCRAEGIRIDEQVVYYGLLFHDAGYHEDHLARGFPTKEALSAHLAATALAARGVPQRTIGKVERAILATYLYGTFKTPEEKAVRAADLAGLAYDFPRFRNNSENLRLEHNLLTGKHLSWVEWVPKVIEVLRFYLSQEIRLTSYFSDTNGESVFHQRARSNVERIRAESGGDIRAS
ncbi:MAG: hypothetical protein AB7Q97_24115 [Gammaproteobacteria bacterium]